MTKFTVNRGEKVYNSLDDVLADYADQEVRVDLRRDGDHPYLSFAVRSRGVWSQKTTQVVDEAKEQVATNAYVDPQARRVMVKAGMFAAGDKLGGRVVRSFGKDWFLTAEMADGPAVHGATMDDLAGGLRVQYVYF